MSSQSHNRKELNERFKAEFGVTLDWVFKGFPLTDTGVFESMITDMLDERDHCRSAQVLFSGADRNKNLRRYALVEYRCHRGCLLGAFVKFRGEEFMFTEQAISIDEHDIDWDAIDNELELQIEAALEHGEFGYPRWHVPRQFEGELHALKDSEGTASNFSCQSLSDFLAFSPSTVTGSPWRAHPFKDTSLYEMNCRHSELNTAGWKVREDARKMARQAKKVVRVTPESR